MKNSKEYDKIESSLSKVEEPISAYLKSPISEATQLINIARKGINMSFLNGLAQKLALSLQEMGEILNVSLRTLQRYEPSKVLDKDISAKALNLANLQAHGIAVFGSEANFNEWLRSEVPALDNKTPLSFLDTSFGFTLVEQNLGRIEHGIFA